MTRRSIQILAVALAVALAAAGAAALGVADGSAIGDDPVADATDRSEEPAAGFGGGPVVAGADGGDTTETSSGADAPLEAYDDVELVPERGESDAATSPPPLTVADEYRLAPETRIEDAASTPDGGAVLVGSTIDPVHANADGRVVKLDATGAVEWTETIGGQDSDSFTAVYASESGVAVVGETESGADHGQDGLLVRLTLDGDVTWQRTSDAGADESYVDVDAAVPGAEGAYALLGSTADGVDQTDWVEVVDEQGKRVWRTSLENESSDQEVRDAEVLATSVDGYGLVGADAGYRGERAAGLDEDGDQVWTRAWGAETDPIPTGPADLLATDDGAFVWTVERNTSGVRRVKVDANGTLQWAEIGGTVSNLAPDLVSAHGPGYVEASGPESVVGVGEDGQDRWELELEERADDPALARLSTDSYVLARGERVTILAPVDEDRHRVDLTAYDSLEDFAADWEVREHPEAETWSLVSLGGDEPRRFATIDVESWPPSCGSPACAELHVVGDWIVEHPDGTVELDDGAWVGASVTEDEPSGDLTVRLVGDGIDESVTVDRAAVDAVEEDAGEVLEPSAD